MLNQLLNRLQSWLESGMQLGFSYPINYHTEKANKQAVTEGNNTVTALYQASTASPQGYSIVSHQNVYHPNKANTLLLRSGQTVSTNLLEKLCQFGIDVAVFCSLKEPLSGALHPITEETIAWLPASHQVLKKTAVQRQKTSSKRTNFLGLPLTLPPSQGITAPVRKRFEETLKALKACPMPNLLVLNPLPREQRKTGKLLEANGVEYQQVHPVLSLETLPYMLKKYQPHTLIIDEVWWQVNTKMPLEVTIENLEIFTQTLAQILLKLEAQQPIADNKMNLLFLLTPQSSQRIAIVNALTQLNKLATVKVLWKPFKRSVLKEALKNFLQTTDVQLERRQEVQSFIR